MSHEDDWLDSLVQALKTPAVGPSGPVAPSTALLSCLHNYVAVRRERQINKLLTEDKITQLEKKVQELEATIQQIGNH